MCMLAAPRRPGGRSVGTASWRGILLALLLGVGASACGSHDPPPGEGLVVGGIIPCAALGPPAGVQYASGTVTALRGVVTWRTTGPGTSVAVFPKTVDARQTVTTNASYQFALAPGDYVFRAHFPPPATVSPFVSVTVRSGITTHVDIPNMCI
jgi:hypothetical protein